MTENLRIGQPPTAPPTPPRAARSPLWQLLLAATVGGLTVLLIGLGVLLVLRVDPLDGGKASPSAQAANAVAPAATSAAPAAAAYGTPTTKDFALSIKILSKQCFGSAGCSITFRVELTQVNSIPLDPDKTYELTYDIRGGEDPLTNTMEITGDQYRRDDEELIDTKSSKSVLKVVITSVTEQ